MFLTVAIPVYNAELYIEACLESILKQTEKDFEILLVDDGSSDNSLGICETYANRFPDVIRVIHKEHSGSLLTRRICLEEAKGQFIYLMDSDDKLVEIDAFKKICKVIQQTHCDMVIFEATNNDVTKKPLLNFPFKHMEVFENNERKKLYELFVTGTSMNHLWNMVFSRELVDFKTDYTIFNEVICGTDLFQAIPLVSNANKIVILKNVFYYHRTTNGSVTRSFNKNAIKSFKIVHLRLEEYLNRWDMLDRVTIRDFLSVKKMRGCIAAIIRIQYSDKMLNNRMEFIKYLENIVEDPYFKDNMSSFNILSIKERLLLYLLNRHYFDVIRLIFNIKRFVLWERVS